MDTRRESTPATRRSKTFERVTGFDPVLMHAPFIFRCAALALDYIVFVALPVLGLIFNQTLGGTGPQGNYVSANTVWFFSVLIGVCNMLLLPAVSGQTLGMMLSRVRIVTLDGRDATVRAILIRNTLGYLLTILTLGLGFFLAAFNRSGRALHDLIAGTVVVSAVKRRRLQS